MHYRIQDLLLEVAAAVASYRMKRLVSRHRKCPSLRLLVCSPSRKRERRTICVTDSALLRVFASLIDGRAAAPSLLYFVHDGFTPSLSFPPRRHLPRGRRLHALPPLPKIAVRAAPRMALPVSRGVPLRRRQVCLLPPRISGGPSSRGSAGSLGRGGRLRWDPGRAAGCSPP